MASAHMRMFGSRGGQRRMEIFPVGYSASKARARFHNLCRFLARSNSHSVVATWRAARCLPLATRYEPGRRCEARRISRTSAAGRPALARPGPSRSGRARTSRSPPQHREKARHAALSVSAPPASAGGTATAPFRSSFPSCRAATDHWDAEDCRFRPRRR